MASARSTLVVTAPPSHDPPSLAKDWPTPAQAPSESEPAPRPVRITHRSRYRFAAEGGPAVAAVKLAPRDWFGFAAQHVEILATPPPSTRRRRSDRAGNRVDLLHFRQRPATLEIVAQARIQRPTRVAPAHDAAATVPAGSPLLAANRELTAFAYRAGGEEAAEPLAAAQRIARILAAEMRFDPRASNAATTAGEALRRRAGVCQDVAHIALAALRILGIEARYLGGYRLPAALPLNGAPRPAELHAWIAVRATGGAWIALDPSTGERADPRLIPVAWGRAFDTVQPIRLHGDLAGFKATEVSIWGHAL